MVAKSGFTAILNGTAMNGYTFANHIVITNNQTRWLSLVFQIRSIFTNGGKLKNTIVLTNFSGAFQHNMGCNDSALVYLYTGTNDCPGTNLHIRRKLGIRMNDCRWIYQNTFSLNSVIVVLNFTIGTQNSC